MSPHRIRLDILIGVGYSYFYMFCSEKNSFTQLIFSAKWCPVLIKKRLLSITNATVNYCRGKCRGISKRKGQGGL